MAVSELATGPVSVIRSFLRLNLTWNSGAAFGVANSATTALSIFGIAFACATLYLSRDLTSKSWGIAAGLIVGGITGNLHDRIFRSWGSGFLQGQVVDWIQLPHWPVFNLADTSIVIAAVLILILTFLNIPPKDAEAMK